MELANELAAWVLGAVVVGGLVLALLYGLFTAVLPEIALLSREFALPRLLVVLAVACVCFYYGYAGLGGLALLFGIVWWGSGIRSD